MAVELTKRRFTVDDYHHMVGAGILSEDERIELIEGEVVEMTPIGNAHAACVDALAEQFITRLRGRAITRVQGPIRLDAHSEPQPDVALLRQRADRYRSELPQPDDILLVVEVADTSLDRDRGVKLPLYARAGIPEAWVANVIARQLEVHRQPSERGYLDAVVLEPDRDVRLSAFPDVVFRVGELFG